MPRVLAVDSGTTTTRVWAVADGLARGPAAARVGARDRRGGDEVLRVVRRLADEAIDLAGWRWDDVEAAVGFGMITSELGLEEIPHLAGPVTAVDLGAALVERRFAPQIPVPVFFVPGVKWSSDTPADDVMRGEETEVVGLVHAGFELPFLYVSPGSHAKFIAVDDAGWIVWSFTTLSGELLWALSRETILAGLIDLAETSIEPEQVLAGADSADRHGFSRTLFLARILNRMQGVPVEGCSSFITGAVAGSDLGALEATARDASRILPGRVLLKAPSKLAHAYADLLPSRAWVRDVRLVDEPYGAIGAELLYAEHRQPSRVDARPTTN